MSRRETIALVCVVLACALGSTPPASAAVSHRGPPRSPQAPPLVSGATAYAAPTTGSQQPAEELEAESAAGSEDQLVRNGLGSPLCRLAASELPANAVRNCRTSRFIATGAPSEDYSFDTNIDTTFGVSIDALIQDYVIRPAWIALVWLVHGLLVAVEWAFQIDLLRGSLTAGLSQALLAAEAQFTRPWLVSALALAAVLTAYNGLVRRQVAQTLGEVAVMLAMIGSAMCVIADPSGTVGALSQWANGASVGALGAVATGDAAKPYGALAASMQQLYEASIEAPWCFLEFGDVGWCDQPSRLDPRLRKAALRIATQLEAGAHASGPHSGVDSEVLANRAQLLRDAQTNGQIFLAFPANGPLRNSVKESSSLFHVLCGGGEDATSCHGPTAAEAEFRANAGTLPRLGGVLVIALVVLGMLLLFGSIVARLLEAAVLSVLFLLLAPVAALAPALGETGRSAFRSWGARLLGAVTAKLLWSVVLGALLATTRVVLSLQGLGWLMQWLLVGTLWWVTFFKRRSLLEATHARSPRTRPTLVRRVAEQAVMGFEREAGKSAWRRLTSHGPPKKDDEPRRKPSTRDRLSELTTVRLPQRRLSSTAVNADPVAKPGRSVPADRPIRMEAVAHTDGNAHATKPVVNGSPATDSSERLERLQAAHAEAAASGDLRRATSLALRKRHVEEQIRPKPAGPSHSEHPGAGSPPSRSPTDANRGHASRHANDGRASTDAHDGRASTEANDGRARIDHELRARREAHRPSRNSAIHDRVMRDPVMRDALEVAERRKRQLGWSWRESGGKEE